ncbi:uncharacterized protein BKA78DRAFT_351660 [Phyllosticta capitalensis]|uniref:Uncharacterized protein n=1 Tax=Phyllosticta capitalensis TaxID=121624 RepID=A0ABR1YW60_9PEZI
MRVIKSQNLAIDQHDSMILAAARVLYETSRPTGMAQQCLPGNWVVGELWARKHSGLATPAFLRRYTRLVSAVGRMRRL